MTGEDRSASAPVKEYTVTGIEYDKSDIGRSAWRKTLLFGGKCGDMVSVRPCAKEYGDKTYLGVLIGEIALGMTARIDPETKKLVTGFSMHNPAIFIPELNNVVFGAGSWWGKIKTADQLRQITDEDISNVWYVKALQQISADKEDE